MVSGNDVSAALQKQTQQSTKREPPDEDKRVAGGSGAREEGKQATISQMREGDQFEKLACLVFIN